MPRPLMTPDKLRAMRARYSITQIDLAEYLKISPRQIIRWESGRSPIPHGTAILLNILHTRRIPKHLREMGTTVFQNQKITNRFRFLDPKYRPDTGD